MRDQGHVFHVESFVVPVDGYTPTMAELTAARQAVVDLERKIDDAVLVPVEELPAQLLPSVAGERRSR